MFKINGLKILKLQLSSLSKNPFNREGMNQYPTRFFEQKFLNISLKLKLNWAKIKDIYGKKIFLFIPEKNIFFLFYLTELSQHAVNLIFLNVNASLRTILTYYFYPLRDSMRK